MPTLYRGTGQPEFYHLYLNSISVHHILNQHRVGWGPGSPWASTVTVPRACLAITIVHSSILHLLSPNLHNVVFARHPGTGELNLEVGYDLVFEPSGPLPLVVFESQKVSLLHVKLGPGHTRHICK